MEKNLKRWQMMMAKKTGDWMVKTPPPPRNSKKFKKSETNRNEATTKEREAQAPKKKLKQIRINTTNRVRNMAASSLTRKGDIIIDYVY